MISPFSMNSFSLMGVIFTRISLKIGCSCHWKADIVNEFNLSYILLTSDC